MCDLTGKKANNGYTGKGRPLSLVLKPLPMQAARCTYAILRMPSLCDDCGKLDSVCAVTFSHRRIKKLQGVNLQYKKVFWPEEKRWVRLRISTKVGLSGRLPTMHAIPVCWSTFCCSRLLMPYSSVSFQGLSHQCSARGAPCMDCKLILSV